jgi:hypothetical protein
VKIHAAFGSALVAALLCPGTSRSAEVTFDGNVAGDFTSGTARLGTFNPDFDPFHYKYSYGIDSAGNMESPNYTRAVSDGNFRPIGGGDFVDGRLSGSGNASGLEGQQLWLFLFDKPNPDTALHVALFSGSTESWGPPPDTESFHILADSADLFVFGTGGHGQPVQLQGLPIPEPAPLFLFAVGGMALTVAVRPVRNWLPRAQLDGCRERGGSASVPARTSLAPGG